MGNWLSHVLRWVYFTIINLLRLSYWLQLLLLRWYAVLRTLIILLLLSLLRLARWMPREFSFVFPARLLAAKTTFDHCCLSLARILRLKGSLVFKTIQIRRDVQGLLRIHVLLLLNRYFMIELLQEQLGMVNHWIWPSFSWILAWRWGWTVFSFEAGVYQGLVLS